jgi:hypothetical protein
MEKSQSSKLEPVNRKEKVGNKIDSLWSENSISDNNTKNESKKLMIKFETNGKEKRKILLKLESGSSVVHSSNYNLLSKLLKEFFNGTNNFE